MSFQSILEMAWQHMKMVKFISWARTGARILPSLFQNETVLLGGLHVGNSQQPTMWGKRQSSTVGRIRWLHSLWEIQKEIEEIEEIIQVLSEGWSVIFHIEWSPSIFSWLFWRSAYRKQIPWLCYIIKESYFGLALLTVCEWHSKSLSKISKSQSILVTLF